MKTRLALLALMVTALGVSSAAAAGKNPWRTDKGQTFPTAPIAPSANSGFKAPSATLQYQFAPAVRTPAGRVVMPAQQTAPATPYWRMPQQPGFGGGLPYGQYPTGNSMGGYPTGNSMGQYPTVNSMGGYPTGNSMGAYPMNSNSGPWSSGFGGMPYGFNGQHGRNAFWLGWQWPEQQ